MSKERYFMDYQHSTGKKGIRRFSGEWVMFWRDGQSTYEDEAPDICEVLNKVDQRAREEILQDLDARITRIEALLSREDGKD